MDLYEITSWIEVNDRETDVIAEFEVSKYYPQTLTEPEEPCEVTITALMANGFNWLEYVDTQCIERITEEAWEFLNSTAEDYEGA